MIDAAESEKNWELRNRKIIGKTEKNSIIIIIMIMVIMIMVIILPRRGGWGARGGFMMGRDSYWMVICRPEQTCER